MEREKEKEESGLNSSPYAVTSRRVSMTIQRGNPAWETIRDAAQEKRAR